MENFGKGFNLAIDFGIMVNACACVCMTHNIQIAKINIRQYHLGAVSPNFNDHWFPTIRYVILYNIIIPLTTVIQAVNDPEEHHLASAQVAVIPSMNSSNGKC